MNVHLWYRLLDGTQDIDVGIPGIFGMDAALHANLCRTSLPGFLGAPGDLFIRKVVRPSAQVLCQFTLGEGAELALEIADVGVIDVAVNNEAHGIATDLAA